MINGNTLIDMGYTPDKWFGQALSEANKKGVTGGKELIQIIDKAIKDNTVDAIEPYINSIPYYKNIEASNELETKNMNQVFNSMDVLMKTPTIVNGAVMPDACPTGSVGQIPVGGIAIAKNAIHPSMHSADVCCSVMASSFGDTDPKIILDVAHAITHFGVGGREEFSDLPDHLLKKIKNNSFLNDPKSIELAHSHLGTQGDGNHFLFVGNSEINSNTIMVTHHGSRGFGARLFKKGMRVAENFRKKISPNTIKKNAWIPFDTDEGQEYWEALQIVREWTKLNHMVLHHEVFLQSRSKRLKYNFWNEHNFVFKDKDLFYHAKGATPLDDKFVPDSVGGLRLIPLNMSEPILVVQGKSNNNNIGFAPHGAGRNFSRTQHKKNNDYRTVNDILLEETKNLDIRFFSGRPDISELPSAYKNAFSIQSQMEKFGLGRVVDKIFPFGSIMAGELNKKW